MYLQGRLDTPIFTYWDVEIMNNSQSNARPVELSYTENRQDFVLNAPYKHYISVSRFEIQTANNQIPMFIPQVELGQNDINKLIYAFYLTSGGSQYTANVTYQTSDNSASLPQPPTAFQELTSKYYYVPTINQWYFMVNQTLTTLYKTTAGLAEAPFFAYDPKTSLVTLYYPTSLVATTNLYVNEPFAAILSTLPISKVIPTAQTTYWYQLLVANLITNSETVNTVSYYKMQQELTSIDIMSPISSIVFLSNLLPVNSEYTTPAFLYGADSSVQNASQQNANTINMVTDFIVPVSNQNNYMNTISYNANGNYRLIDLVSTQPLRSLDIRVAWKDKFGNLHPLYLGSQCFFSAKFVFIKKNYNNIDIN